MNRYAIKSSGMTDQGRVRGNNEDALWVDPDMDLIIVADGMGGHKSGEKASGIAVSALPVYFKQLAKNGAAGELHDEFVSVETKRLGSSMQMANRTIYEAALRDPNDRGMGTTCTAVFFHGDRLSVAHVGDTRCYVVRRGKMEQLTQDHSLVMEQLRRGEITEEEAARSNQNILTRALGTEESVEVDVAEHLILPGDMFVLCSDGLNKELTDEQVRQVVTETNEPAAVVQKLIAMANAAGGRDNVTVAAARVDKSGLGASLKGLFRSA